VRDSLVRWIEPAGAMVEEIEDQRVQHLQRRGADRATMTLSPPYERR
jgi:hypothetical protein